jgi:hypothetical protein
MLATAIILSVLDDHPSWQLSLSEHYVCDS